MRLRLPAKVVACRLLLPGARLRFEERAEPGQLRLAHRERLLEVDRAGLEPLVLRDHFPETRLALGRGLELRPELVDL